jgi:hypothetical protein
LSPGVIASNEKLSDADAGKRSRHSSPAC